MILLVLLFPLFSVFGLDAGKLWEHYKRSFVSEEGFVVDPYNQYRVTSEAQGYTLTIAVLANDKETFYRVWEWTRKHLRRRDGLFAWLWVNGFVADENNATDADLFIAYALLLAGERWGDENLKREAESILKEVKKLTLPFCPSDFVLLPAKRGFVGEDTLKVKVAYYVPFIFRKLSGFPWEGLYEQTYELYRIEGLSTDLGYDIFEKEFRKGELIDADGLRVLVYAYIDDKKKFYELKGTFLPLYEFYKRKGYIPDKFNYRSGEHSREGVPFCFYYFFGELYGDASLLEKFKEGLKHDKKNYYCYALLLLTLLHAESG
ncbi:MAG: hypothetical protein GXO04_05285 [Aquificae bacterium]|nr:hypothetical protein [Aquificota bacterium]